MKHLLLYFYITAFLIFSNCYISNDNITITNSKNIILMISDGMRLSQISGADNFIGTYHNTDVHYKILSSFQIEN